MIKSANLFQLRVPGILLAASAALLLLPTGCATHAPDSVRAAAALGSISDAEIRDVVTRVAKRQIHPLADGDYIAAKSLDESRSARPPEGIAWSYPWGVTLYGLSRYAQLTHDPEAERFVARHNQICGRYYAWLAGLGKQFGQPEVAALARASKIRGLMTLGSLDSCGSMGNQMLEDMLRHPGRVTPEEKQVVARIADWIVSRQDRLPDGALWRSKSMGGTLWPDDLYMGGVFLSRWGKYTGDSKFLDDAANQIVEQAALEQDTDGLWFHGYFVNDRKHAPFKWGRGNGWVTVTLVETLSALPRHHPLRPKLIKVLSDQIEGLKKVQAPDGMWRQVLDQPELWEETSCTAMFAYGIASAVNHGWIARANLAVARRAFAGIARNVTPEGAVNGTCQGTNIGPDLDYYVKRPRPDDDLHGRGVVLLAGTEILIAAKR